VFVLYRVIIKQTLRCTLSEQGTNKLIRTIIYGTDANAISVANALKFETPSDLKLLVLWIKTIKMQQSECWICPY
jgi:hypothetical protein